MKTHQKPDCSPMGCMKIKRRTKGRLKGHFKTYKKPLVKHVPGDLHQIDSQLQLGLFCAFLGAITDTPTDFGTNHYNPIALQAFLLKN